MSAVDVRENVISVYNAAIANKNHAVEVRSLEIAALLNGLRLFGREAGSDFIETHIDVVIAEAIANAKGKRPSMTIRTYGSGIAAIEGMVAALETLTSLNVKFVGGREHKIEISWG